jgi:hypothetical protein
MIDCVYYNDEIRCHMDGSVVRFFKKKGWKIVENTANDGGGYNYIGINGKNIKRHRLIAYCFLGLGNINEVKSGTDVIDHIDGNKLNNSVNNLRITNQSGNQHNRKNVKGYCFHKRSQKYQALIRINNKLIHLGSYETEEEAKEAYLEGKRKYHLW